MIEIPLNSNPEQLFTMVLDGHTYDFRVISNSRLKIWSMGISKDGVQLVDNIALLGGVNIMAQYNIGIREAYIINMNEPSLDPAFDSLGTTSKLVLVTDGEIELV